MAFDTSAELNTILISTLIGLIVAGGGAIVSWLRYKTSQWERMTQQAVDNAQMAVDATMQNRELIKKNTDITIKVAEESNSTLKRLKEASDRAMELRHQIRDRLALSERTKLTDDLDEITARYERKEEHVKTAENRKPET